MVDKEKQWHANLLRWKIELLRKLGGGGKRRKILKSFDTKQETLVIQPLVALWCCNEPVFQFKPTVCANATWLYHFHHGCTTELYNSLDIILLWMNLHNEWCVVRIYLISCVRQVKTIKFRQIFWFFFNFGSVQVSFLSQGTWIYISKVHCTRKERRWGLLCLSTVLF